MSLVDKDGVTTSKVLDEDCVFIGVDDAKNVGTASDIAAVPTSADKDEFDRYKKNAYVIFNDKDKVVAVVYDTVNNELDLGDDVQTASTVAAKAVTLTDLSAKAITDASETVTVTAASSTVKPGETVTLTATLSAKNADKNITVVVNDKTVGNVTITVKAGENTGTATFTMPNSAVEFTFVSATATAK